MGPQMRIEMTSGSKQLHNASMLLLQLRGGTMPLLSFLILVVCWGQRMSSALLLYQGKRSAATCRRRRS